MSSFNLTLHTCGPGEPDHGLVKTIQSLAALRTGIPLTVDGIYGPATVWVVAVFQHITGYPGGDGACGPTTWDNLLYVDVIFAGAVYQSHLVQ